MTFVVPFDGSALSRTALTRASEFADAIGAPIITVTVIPAGNESYARDRGWLEPRESYTIDQITAELQDLVAEHCPTADFRYRVVDRYANAGTIANRIRSVARRVEATMVFIGSEDAGRIVTSVSSVGRSVAAHDAYDVVIVRRTEH